MTRLATTAALTMLLLQTSLAGEPLKGPELKAIGPMTFAPNGVLIVGDPKQAVVFAIETGDTTAAEKMAPLNVKGLGQKLADMLGTEAGGVLIKDLAINPISGTGYLGVHRGRGPEATPVILKVVGDKVSEFSLADVGYTMAELPNAPKDSGSGRRNKRTESITDIAFSDGKVIVAGLSNEEFASKLRMIDFPFASVTGGTSVEVYHGAHGALETRSPVQTFIPMNIGNKPHLLAAYTCTPLVKFPITDLMPGNKVQGTTIAELGNRNKPLDMVAYTKGDKQFLLIANNQRGVMKMDTEPVSSIDGITERVRGTAGLKYETIKEWEGVVQLEQLDASHACLIITGKDSTELKTVTLP